MEGVAGIVAPADGSFPGAGSMSAPASNLPVELPPSVGRVKGGEVPQLHRPLFSINLMA
jgi:hypothetical protein